MKSRIVFIVASLAFGFLTFAVQRPGAKTTVTSTEVQLNQFVSGNAILTETTGAPASMDFVPGEVFVKFINKSDADQLLVTDRGRAFLQLKTSPKLTEALARFGFNEASAPFTFSKTNGLRDVVKLTSTRLQQDKDSTRELLLLLRSQPEIEYADLNWLMKAQQIPNDFYYLSSGAWGQDFRDLWGLQKISVESAWQSSTGQNVVVAVSDSGVDYDHEDLAANIWQNAGEVGVDNIGHDKRSNGVDDDVNGFVDDWRGYDFVTTDGTPSDNDPMDDFGHGTHVAGTIAAVGNNTVGIVGVAHGSKIMALKGLNRFGSGSSEDLVKTILYAADNGAKVINASWGGFSSEPQPMLVAAVAHAHDVKGVVVVVAAGNSNADVGTEFSGFFPACLRNVITVSAYNHLDSKASFSNFGQKIDVAAPGGGDTDPTNTIREPSRSVLSPLSSQAISLITSSGQLVVGTKYLRQAGTSMASPHAAGVAALVRSLHPEFSPEQVRQTLHFGVDDIESPGFDVGSGYGRINANKALILTMPLAVQLTAPIATVTGSCSVNVEGIAAGVGFSSWRLEFAPSNNPTDWTPLSSSTTPVSNGVLANWNLNGLSDGTYIVHLVAQNTNGQLFEDRLVVRVDNAIISSPVVLDTVFSSAFRAGTSIPIMGTASGCNFSSYKLSIRRGSTGEPLNNASLSLVNGGLQSVNNGLLATWDTSNLPADYYQLTLEVLQTDALTNRKSILVIVDPTLHPGWPKNLGIVGLGGLNLAITDHLNIADVNTDGAQDILIGYGDTVRVLDHNGNPLAGWPQSVDLQHLGAVIQKAPALGDVDGDGQPEIVAANNASEIFVWNADGTLLDGWPRNVGGSINSVSISDVAGNSEEEIIATDWTGRVKVLDKSGQFLPGWPQIVAPPQVPILTFACIADLDGDGKKEIVTSNGLFVYALEITGALKSGWPRQISTKLPSLVHRVNPAVGDLSGNGQLAVVISGDDKVFAFAPDGTDLPNWPKTPTLTTINSPAIGDIDGDGRVEVVTGGSFRQTSPFLNTGFLYAWHGDGTLLPNWPIEVDDQSLNGPLGSPILTDVDGDRIADVVVDGQGGAGWTPLRGPFSLRAFRFDTSIPPGFSKPTIMSGAFNTNTAAVGDIDNDGLAEVAWLDRRANLYVWDLPIAPSPPAWPMFHHDARHSGSAVVSRIAFSQSNFVATEGDGRILVNITRNGDTSNAARIVYSTHDTSTQNNCSVINGAASSRCDYLITFGILNFAEGESSKTIAVSIVDDGYVEGVETFTITLANSVGVTLGSPSSATLRINDNDSVNGNNPADSARFFVRQHYLDFLNREPDPDGLDFWEKEITSCGTNAQCVEVKRINVSAAFFLSIEFQETGYLVYRMYKSAHGNLQGAPVPIRFANFLTDTQQIGQDVQVGIGNWQAQLEANKQAFTLSFVQRAAFQAAFPNSVTAEQFVNQLDINAGRVLSTSERLTLVASLGTTPSDPTKRAAVLRAIAEDQTLRDAELMKAFVLMQYFGYLRRNPDDIGFDGNPDPNFNGFTFWLNKLNEFNGNFINAEMVKAFIVSIEYRQRFGS